MYDNITHNTIKFLTPGCIYEYEYFWSKNKTIFLALTPNIVFILQSTNSIMHSCNIVKQYFGTNHDKIVTNSPSHKTRLFCRVYTP